jgi:hypothetical protein
MSIEPSATPEETSVYDRPAFRFTIGRMLFAIGWCALWFALLRFLGGQIGFGVGFFVVQAISLPFVLCITVVVFVRPSPIKDWVVHILFTGPFWVVLTIVGVTEIRMFHFGRDPYGLILQVLLLCIVNTILFRMTRPLMRGMFPKRCPNCHRFSMLRDYAGDHHSPNSPRNTHWCWRCGVQFRRWAVGPWRQLVPPIRNPGRVGSRDGNPVRQVDRHPLQ